MIRAFLAVAIVILLMCIVIIFSSWKSFNWLGKKVINKVEEVKKEINKGEIVNEEE